MAYRSDPPRVPAYLAEFHEEVALLPTALRSRFSEMREMDDRAATFMLDADKSVTDILRKAAAKGPGTEALKKSYQEVMMLQGKAVESVNQKVEIAERAFDVVDEVIKNLDDKLREFETQLRKDGRWPSANVEKPPRQGSPSEGDTTVTCGQSNASGTRPSGGNGTGATVTTQQKSRRSTSSRTTGSGSQSARCKAVKSEPPPKAPIVDEMVVEPAEAVYCYCKSVSYGEMIGCDNEKCPVEWFHYACVGITKAPEDGWLCPDCRKGATKKKQS